MHLPSHTVAYRHGDTVLNGFLIFDDVRQDRRPGIFIVHGGEGLDDHTRAQARRFAELGFVVFAGDMYGKDAPQDRDSIRRLIIDFREHPAKLRARAQAGVDQLVAHPLVDGRIGAVGYCFGGMTVLELARRGGADLLGVVSVHGTLTTIEPARAGSVRAKILVCHGVLDPHVTMDDVKTFVDEMNAAGADYQLIAYAGAVHGFTHEHADGSFPGVAYHKPTDERSFAAMTGFFNELFATGRPEFVGATR